MNFRIMKLEVHQPHVAAGVEAGLNAIVYHTNCAARAGSGAPLDCISVAHVRCLAAVNYCRWSRICGACERVLDGKTCRIGATATQVYGALGRRSRAFVEADSRAAADPCKRAHVRMLDTHLVSLANAEHSVFARRSVPAASYATWSSRACTCVCC
jgi:hypothetical protein